MVFRNKEGLKTCLKVAIRSKKDIFSISMRDKINSTKKTAGKAVSSVETLVFLKVRWGNEFSVNRE